MEPPALKIPASIDISDRWRHLDGISAMALASGPPSFMFHFPIITLPIITYYIT